MKAVYSESGKTKRIKLDDGTVFEALPGEAKDAFLKRVTSVVDNLELDKEAVEAEAESKKAAAKKAPVKKPETKKAAPAKKAVAEKAAPAKKAVVEKAAPAKKAVAEKAAPAKKVNRNPTLRDALNSKQEGDVLVGKVVDMLPFRSETPITGVVRQCVIDKRVNRAYLRVYDSNGKLYHTDVACDRYSLNKEETAKLEAAQKKQEKERFAILRKREEDKAQRKAELAAARLKAKEERRAENRRKFREMAAVHKTLSVAARRVRVAENGLARLNIALKKAAGRADQWAKEAIHLKQRIEEAERSLAVLREQEKEIVNKHTT